MILILIMPALAAGCARAPSHTPGVGDWYVLRGGKLLRGKPGTDGGTSRAAQPWTVQQRIADLLVRDGRLYLAINGLGLSTSDFPPDGAFADHYQPDIYGGRTITQIYPEQDGMLLHLYVNRTLASPLLPPPSARGITFLHIPWDVERQTEMRSDTPPYRVAHPDWEAVAAVRTSSTVYAVEWKWTDETRTEFHYTSYDVDTGREIPMERTAFRAAYGFAEKSADAPVQALFLAAIRATRVSTRPTTALHLVLRDGETTQRLRYQPPGYTEAPDVDLVVVPGRRAGGAVWALTASGDLLAVARDGQRTVTQSLPPLPQGYRYTLFDLAATPEGARIAAAWEEARFTVVGEAGLYVGPVRAL